MNFQEIRETLAVMLCLFPILFIYIVMWIFRLDIDMKIKQVEKKK